MVENDLIGSRWLIGQKDKSYEGTQILLTNEQKAI